MALNITSAITTPEGIEVATSYGRVYVTNGAKGNQIDFGVQLFASESAFEAGLNPIFPADLTLGGSVAYDYAKDKKNILDLAHDEMIKVLADQNISATKNLG